MKIRAHNLNSVTNAEGEVAIKTTKIVSRQHLNKSKTAVLKENIPPQQNLGDKKKIIKNAQQTQQSLQATQTSIRIRTEKDRTVVDEY